MDKKYLWFIAAAVIVIAVGLIFGLRKDETPTGATIGSRLIENYVPVVMDARAILTNFPFWTTSSTTIESELAVTATTTLGHYFKVGDVDYYDISGTFQNSSSTLAAVHNPWRATSTVMFTQLDVTTPASTSLNFYVGTSTAANTLGGLGLGCTAGSPVTCDGVIIDEATVPTTTAASSGTWGGASATIAASPGALVNISTTGEFSGYGTAGTSISPLVVGPDEWVLIYATTTSSGGGSSYVPEIACATAAGCAADGGSDGLTNTGNSFDGTFFMRFAKP